MESSNDSKPEQVSFHALSCDAAMGKFVELPQTEALKVKRSCDTAHQEGYLACRNPHFNEFVDEGEGFDLKNKIVTGTRLTLQPYIPVPDRGSSNLPIRFSDTCPIGMLIGDLYPKAVYSNERNLLYREKPEIDRAYRDRPLFRGRRILLLSSGPDALVEGLMRDRDEIDIFRNLNAMGFVGITALDLSVNVGDCYAGQILDITRSLVYAREVEIAGTPAIPNVFAGDLHQRRLWVDYLNATRIPLVSMNCQLQKRRKEDVEFDKNTLRFLFENVPHELHVVLHGFSLTRANLSGLEPYMLRLHFADSAPFISAQMNMLEYYDASTGRIESLYRRSNTPDERARVVEENIRAREEFLHRIISESLTSHVTLTGKRIKKQ